MRKTLLAALTIGVIGTVVLETQGPKHEKNCMAFLRSSTPSPGAELVYTFQDKEGNLYGARGNPNLSDSMERGKSYIPLVKTPLLGPERLVSAKTCE